MTDLCVLVMYPGLEHLDASVRVRVRIHVQILVIKTASHPEGRGIAEGCVHGLERTVDVIHHVHVPSVYGGGDGEHVSLLHHVSDGLANPVPVDIRSQSRIESSLVRYAEIDPVVPAELYESGSEKGAVGLDGVTASVDGLAVVLLLKRYDLVKELFSGHERLAAMPDVPRGIIFRSDFGDHILQSGRGHDSVRTL